MTTTNTSTTPTPPQRPDPDADAAPDRDPLAALMHRWFVQYNPLYLVSATLVLGGLWLVAREASSTASLSAIAGVGATAELYALALIAAAAGLARTGQRRAAAMLGLLAVLYQGDLMLRTEAAAFVDGAGPLLSSAWAALFVLKLALLARALGLRLSRSALLVPAIGAITIAAMPHLLRALAPADRSAPVAIAVFAVGALALWTRREVHSAIGWDVRGARSIRGTWALWGALGLAHALYWCVAFRADPLVLVPVALLLATRFATRERAVWLLTGLALLCTAHLTPGSLALLAAMSTIVLALRALRTPVLTPPEPPRRALSPYRGSEPPPSVVHLPVARFVRADPAATTRLALGALAAAHLACWSAGWDGACAWPAHDLALDAVFTLAALSIAWAGRSALPLLPLALLHAHLVRELGHAPTSSAGWGWLSVACGFGLLAIALYVSSRTRIGATDPPGRDGAIR